MSRARSTIRDKPAGADVEEGADSGEQEDRRDSELDDLRDRDDRCGSGGNIHFYGRFTGSHRFGMSRRENRGELARSLLEAARACKRARRAGAC